MKRKNKVFPYIRYGTEAQARGHKMDFRTEIEKHIAPNREQLVKMVQEFLNEKRKRL